MSLVACNDWSSLVDSPSCLNDALITLEWTPEDELTNKTSEELKNLMIYKLYAKLDYKEHSIGDLAVR
jgi:hypothetical protein